MTKEKKQYEAPSLTAVSFRMERGYGASAILKNELTNYWFEFDSNDPNVTQYDQDNSWADYTWGN